MRSVASKASSSSGVTREVSPTTSPGSSARASASRPSVAFRSPSRSLPANRCGPDGAPTTSGGALPRTRSTAAMSSPSDRAGTTRAATRSRVDGSSDSQGERPPVSRDAPRPGRPPNPRGAPRRERASTITSTGVRVASTVPSAWVTRVTSASNSRAVGATWSPLIRGRVSRGSEVISTSAVTSAYLSASAGTGPRRRSAACSPAEAAAVATQRSTAATDTHNPRRTTPRPCPTPEPPRPVPVSPCLAPEPPRPVPASPRSAPEPPDPVPVSPSPPPVRAALRPATDSAPAAIRDTAATAVTPPGDAPTLTAAVSQTAAAGATSRRSIGPSALGCEAPSRRPEAACTGLRPVAPGKPAARVREPRASRGSVAVRGRGAVDGRGPDSTVVRGAPEPLAAEDVDSSGILTGPPDSPLSAGPARSPLLPVPEPLMAAPDAGDRRSGGLRSRSLRGARRPSGTRRAPCGSR